MAGKVTQVNVEGRNYGFVAGQAAKGACTALAADWVKPITLPEDTTLVDGMIISVVFVNTTSVGYSGTKTVYSSDGLHFFYDQALTDPVELPPAGCYDAVNVQGQEYTLACFPVITFGSLSLPVCDSRGHYAGGALWAAGDTVAALYLDARFMLLYSVVDEVTEGVSSPVSSNAVARDCVLKSEVTDEVAIGNMYSVYSDAVARAITANNEASKLIRGTFGVLGGAIGVDSMSLQGLWNLLCGNTNSWGKGVGGICGGSVSVTDDSLGWCNFLYIPHRTGISSDNWRYGTLLLFPMTSGSWIRFYRTSSTKFNLVRSI